MNYIIFIRLGQMESSHFGGAFLYAVGQENFPVDPHH